MTEDDKVDIFLFKSMHNETKKEKLFKQEFCVDEKKSCDLFSPT